jgi:hypothetical protein
MIRFKITIESGYSGRNMLVKNGATILTAYSDGWYIISSIDADVNIIVTGVVKSDDTDDGAGLFDGISDDAIVGIIAGATFVLILVIWFVSKSKR